ncbi:Crinkler (CRN), partial [Phytophthora megakarya]
MVELELFCALVANQVGAQGSTFSVEIDANESVDILKDVIREKIKETFIVVAMDLQLFLAKKGGAWLLD